MRNSYITTANTLKTNYRPFNNVISDLVRSIERKTCRGQFKETFSVAYLLSLCKGEAYKNQHFSITNIRTYTRRRDADIHLGSFDLCFNIGDCDIMVRVCEWHDNITARLFLGRRFSQNIHCLDANFIPLLNEIYNTASAVRIAA